MNFRFTLHSELGAYILARDPIGWDKASTLFKRSPKYHGVFYEKNIDLTFYCGAGKEYIDNVLEELGIDALVTIKIEIACGCEYVPDAPDYSIDYSDDYGSRGENSCTYDELYLGKLDLKTWSTVDNKSTVNIIQEGPTDTVMNRLDTVIDITKLETLDGTSLTAFDYAPLYLLMHSKAITFVSEITAQSGANNESGALLYRHDDNEFKDILYFPIYPEKDEIGANTISEIAYQVDRDNPDNPESLITLPASTQSVTVSYRLKGKFYLKPPAGESGTYRIASMYIWQAFGTDASSATAIYANLTGCTDLYDPSMGIPAPSSIEYNFDVSGSYTVANPTDESGVYFWIESIQDAYDFCGSVNDDYVIGVDLDDVSFVNISSISTTEPTNAKAFAVFEVGARIAQSLTNQTDAFRSNYFGRTNAQPHAEAANGCGALTVLTNGALIRNFPIADTTGSAGTVAGRPLRMSMNQYFDGLNAIHNLGMGIEKVDDVFYIRIEPKEYFYQDTLLFQLSNVPNLKISVAPEYYYSKLNIGYEQWQIEQTNGLDEFNSVRQYDLGLKVIDNTLEQKSGLIAGGYLIEVTRRKQFPDSFTEDDAHDNDNFIICTGEPGEITGGPLDGLHVAISEKDENFSNVNNVLSPETSYNLRISPARNALRWSPVVNVGLLKYPSQKLKLTNGEGNFKMESEFTSDVCPGRWNNNLFSEGQDIQWDDADNTDNNPLWIPLIATFNYPLNRTQARLLQNNPYGYIEISERSTVYEKWFILEAKYNPVGGMTEFKLLKKWQ